MVNVVERPDGVNIAGFFITAIVAISLVSRLWRTLELRVDRIELDEAARRFVDEIDDGENVRGLQETTMPARKTDKTSKPAVRKPAKRTAAQGKVCHDAAGIHGDRQGKPREGSGRRQAGLRLHRQPAAAAARHRGDASMLSRPRRFPACSAP